MAKLSAVCLAQGLHCDAPQRSTGQHLAHHRRHVVRGEIEVLEQRAGGRALAVAVEADHRRAAVFPPAVGDARFDGDARQLRRQHARLVLGALAVEHGRARHRHHAHRNAFLGQRGLRMQRELHFAARGQDDGLRFFVQADFARLGEHIRAAADQVEAGLRRIGQVLPRQQQRARPAAVLDRAGPGGRGLGAVAGAPDIEAGDQSQRRRMLDALVRRPVFAEADRVVREDVDDADAHQRGHADGVAAVVGEGQEGAAVGHEAAVQRDAVHHRGHAELAHAVVDVAPAVGRAVVADAQRRRARGVGQVRAREVGRAAEHFRQRFGEGFERDLAGLARGDVLRLAVRGRRSHRPRSAQSLSAARPSAAAPARPRAPGARPCTRRSARSTPLRLRCLCLAVPGAVGRLGDDERLVRPAERGARGFDLVGAERLAMRLGAAAAVRRAAADAGAGDDQRRLGRALLGLHDRRIDGGDVMAIERADDLPAVGVEALGRVVDEPGLDAAVDADAVVVVERDELVQLPCRGQRAGLVAHAFHQAAVAEKDIGVVVRPPRGPAG